MKKIITALLAGCLLISGCQAMPKPTTVEAEKSESTNVSMSEENSLPNDAPIPIYLYESTPDHVQFKQFDNIGNLLLTFTITERPSTIPIVCKSNGDIYFVSKNGIFSYSVANQKLNTIKDGSYGEIAIVGDKLFFCQQGSGKIEVCDLNGENTDCILEDAQISYEKKETMQNVSFLVSSNTIFYVALNADTGTPSVIKKQDMSSKVTEVITTADRNVQLLTSYGNKLYYQTVPSAHMEERIKTLYEYDLSKKSVRTISTTGRIAIGENVIYYTDALCENFFRYTNGESTKLLSENCSSLFLFQEKLYYASDSSTPYKAYDLNSGSVTEMPNDFLGQLLEISLDESPVGNIID